MLDFLQKRRSIRVYQKRAVPAEMIETLKEALLRSPSSRGRNPWQFIFVKDQGFIHQLARSKEFGSSFLERAPLVVVIAADENKSDVWIEDCSIAATILQLQAQSMGLGSCWVQIRERHHSIHQSSESFVKEILGLDASIRVESLVGIGFPDEEKPGHDRESLNWDQIEEV